MINLKFSPFFHYNISQHSYFMLPNRITKTSTLIVDDKIISGDGEEQEIQNLLVEKRKLYEITLLNGNTIVVDENNYLFTKNDGWMRAKDIAPKMLILNSLNLMRNQSLGEKPVGYINHVKSNMMPVYVPEKCSVKLAEWIGILSAYGEFDESNNIKLTIDEDKFPHLVDHYIKLTKELFNVTPLRNINIRENRLPFWLLTSKNLCEFLKTFLGRKYGLRKVPEFIVESSLEEQLAYIKGIGFKAYKERNGVVLYQGISKPIYDFCALVLRSCGYQISQQSKFLGSDKYLFYYIRIMGKYKESYLLSFYDQECFFINYKWATDYVFLNDKKVQYRTIAQRKKKNKNIDFNHVWIPLKKIKFLGERDSVVIKVSNKNGIVFNQIVLAGCL